MFPDAKLHFFDPDADQPMGPEDADFVFVPDTMLAHTRPERLDLAINMVSFQEMTAVQVDGYVRHAHELGARYLYSLNRDRSPYNPQMTSVREIIGQAYWPQHVEVLPGVQYTQMLHVAPPQPVSIGDRAHGQARKAAAKSAAKKLKKSATKKPDLGYKHLVGWRRMDP